MEEEKIKPARVPASKSALLPGSRLQLKSFVFVVIAFLVLYGDGRRSWFGSPARVGVVRLLVHLKRGEQEVS